MKKGSSHIDWSISIGVFLVSIIALMVLIKPGVKEASKDDILLNQIQQSFEEEVFWTIKKVPVFVHKLDPSSGNNERKIIVELITSGWRFSKFEPTVYENEFDVSFETSRKFVLECNSSGCETNDRDGPFLLTYYSDNVNPNEPNFERDLCTDSDRDHCDAELGITEDLRGIDDDRITDLKNENYEELKADWGLPENKNFAVYEGEEKLFGEELPQQLNVFSRRVKYWLLDNDGERVSKVIAFLVW